MAGMADLVEIVQPLVDGWERGDFRPHPSLLALDLVLTGFTVAGEDRAEGAQAISEYLRQFFSEWRDYRISVGRITRLDDRHVLIEGRQHGVGRGSEIEIDETLFVVLAIADGLVRGIHWHARRE